MSITPDTWLDALEWLTVYTDRYITLLLTTEGGLVIEGPTFAGVHQRRGAFGVELAGLNYWFAEGDVAGVVIHPDRDSLTFHVRDQATFTLVPMQEP